MPKKNPNKVILPAVFVLFVATLMLATNLVQPAFAESNTNPDVRISEQLRKNPLAIKIIQEMESQKLRYQQMMQGDFRQLPTAEQVEVEEKRKIANQILRDDLKSMEKQYEDFTPTNSFAKFVAKLNSSHQEIFWDQFDYLKTKVDLANAARNSVLENGGSLFEAQKAYFKYASMSRVEMISYIQELNVKYGFADESIQQYFDGEGKLPRFEEDEDSPCYGCESSKSKPIPPNKLSLLQAQLSELRQEFLTEDSMEQKKSLVDSMNSLVGEIREITYAKKI